MSKKRTDLSKYPSRYSPQKWVTAAQYLTELICEKKAQTSGKELPIKFWEFDEWKKYYKWQIGLANKLIKKYDPDALIRALKANKRIYSLRYPFDKIIDKYKVADQEKPVDMDLTTDCVPKPKRVDNIISKLKELDGEEKN